LKEKAEAKKNGKQVKINDILAKSTAPLEFTREGVLHAVARFVACDDQVCQCLVYFCICRTDIWNSPWQLLGKICFATV
jgi:hypothetical protein